MRQEWKGGSKGRGYMYTYGWFTLRFDRKQQNSVKQIILQLKKNSKMPCYIYTSWLFQRKISNINKIKTVVSCWPWNIYIEVKCKTQYFIVWVEIYELENKNCIVKTIKKFFTYILHDLRLAEFTDMKPQVQMDNCKVIWLHGGSMPLALVLFKYQWYIHHVFSIHSAINEQISSIFWLW